MDYSERAATLIYDCHTINASTGDMTEVEVKYFCGLVRKYIKDKFNIDSDYRVNTITYANKDEPGVRKLKGVSYIYWKEPGAYHLILGNRPDGTSLTRQVEVDCEENESTEQTINSWDDITSKPASSWDDIMDDNTSGKSWADLCETPQKPKKIITIKEEPLIPDFVYTRNNGTKINITMQAFFITSYDDEQSLNYDMYKLSGLVPKNVTVKQLHSLFDIFSNKEGYPQIEIKHSSKTDAYSKNIAFITFCPGTNDARFAKEIMLFTKLKIDGKDIIIKFDHPLSHFDDRNSNKKSDHKFNEKRSRGGYGRSKYDNAS